MANHKLRLVCTHEGCKRTRERNYTSKKKLEEARKSSSYTCSFHRAENSLDKAGHLTVIEEYEKKWVWSYNEYKQALLRRVDGDGFEEVSSLRLTNSSWAIDVNTLPLGSKIRVETEIYVSEPKEPLELPEWTGVFIAKYPTFFQKEYHAVNVVAGLDADFILLPVYLENMYLGKYTKGSRLSEQAYRKPNQEEIQALYGYMAQKNKIGSDVNFHKVESYKEDVLDTAEPVEAVLVSYANYTQARLVTKPKGKGNGHERTVSIHKLIHDWEDWKVGMDG